MAELVDALGSGSSVRTDVGVRVSPSAPAKSSRLANHLIKLAFFFFITSTVLLKPLSFARRHLFKVVNPDSYLSFLHQRVSSISDLIHVHLRSDLPDIKSWKYYIDPLSDNSRCRRNYVLKHDRNPTLWFSHVKRLLLKCLSFSCYKEIVEISFTNG